MCYEQRKFSFAINYFVSVPRIHLDSYTIFLPFETFPILEGPPQDPLLARKLFFLWSHRILEQ